MGGGEKTSGRLAETKENFLKREVSKGWFLFLRVFTENE